ncbi:hypothetical protein Tsubulata_016641 [Turnera subulata]|uniref:DNA replication checkpoint mediator MRC1 domain-containing protein n=1 Tax=Turnera subulata TaxID=218843 RepID=A0A9Q0FM32_9ROSI|nr:hypothetical protein Tsubulata_016641 [Turnera subulata]
MDSDEEFLSFSDDTANPSSPVLPGRKLKRLKKAATVQTPKQPRPTTPSKANDESAPTLPASSPPLPESPLDTSQKSGEDSDGAGSRSAADASPLKGFEWGNEFDSIFNGPEGEEDGTGVEFDSVEEELDGNGKDGESPSAKKRLILEDGFDETDDHRKKKKKKKKKRKKRSESFIDDDGFEDLPFSVPSTKKERRDRLRDLRIESQRLLRETREASFKPVPVVKKPVSSLLEKIRQRKREISENSVNIQGSSSLYGDEVLTREVELDYEFENSSFQGTKDVVVKKAGTGKTAELPVDLDNNNFGSPSATRPEDASNQISEDLRSPMGLKGELKQKFRAPVDDTQDLSFESQTSDSKDEPPRSPLDEVLAPSMPSMNLKFDSVAPDDSLRGVRLPMRAFVDEEAEEEDDSDNDISRFKDDEEDVESMDSDELNDIIATGFEEEPIDNEMRNQLHQKWLEQQDARGTEKLLQKLNCGSKQREMTFPEEKEAEEGEEVEEVEEEDPDEATENYVTQNDLRSNLKKAREMICRMFTEKDDAYISSDEETEERIVKQQLSDSAEQQGSFLSPAEDEGSKEIFGLIKKLNNVPDARKKPKISSYFHSLSIGGNRSVPSKSSFVGRGTKSSLPSLRKHGSSNARSFVFERDDTNGKSTTSISEDSSDLMQRESRPRKTASARFCGSQITSSSQKSQANTIRGPSLHEILQGPPLRSSHLSHNSGTSNQVEAIYAAFKVDQIRIKKEQSVSIRMI